MHVIRCADSRDSEGSGKPSHRYGTPGHARVYSIPRLKASCRQQMNTSDATPRQAPNGKFELNGNGAPAKAAVQ